MVDEFGEQWRSLSDYLTTHPLWQTLAENVDVDLWNYQTEDRRSIRKALDFLTPVALGERKWQYQELGGVKPESGLGHFSEQEAMSGKGAVLVSCAPGSGHAARVGVTQAVTIFGAYGDASACLELSWV